MRDSDIPYLTDLLAISLRWLALFGLAISLGTGGVFLTERIGVAHVAFTGFILGLPALWNGFISALAIFNRRLRWHRHINVALDMLFGMGLFAFTGGFFGQVPWVTLLPLFSGAIYFEAPGALAVAGIMSIFQVAFTLMGQDSILQLLPIGMMVGLNLASAVLVTLLSAPIIKRLRISYKNTLNQRKESELQLQRQEHDRMRSLFAMIETFSSTLNYQTVLQTVLRTAIEAMNDHNSSTAEEMVAAVLLFGEQNELQISAAEHFLARDLTVTLPADQGALGEAMRKGEAQIVLKPEADPELSLLATMLNQREGLCLPLIRSLNAYGVMVFGHTAPEYFTTERVETLQMLSNQAVIALQNARLYQDLAHEKERILQSQEEAQKKLARSLHDGPTQSVSAIAMRLNIARRMLDQSPGEVAGELSRIEELARRTTQEIRHMLFTLRPLVLESEGLVPALKTIAEKLNELYQQNVLVSVDDDIVERLENNQQTVIFYLAEEAVNNARKHARAPEIRVRLVWVPKVEDIAMLEIADNGVGFDLASVMNSYDRRGSLGMINLRERADLINGLLKIESAVGKGTRVRVFIPLTEAAADRLHQRK